MYVKVITIGGSAKATPRRTEEFQLFGKDWVEIMPKTAESKLVAPCCQNEMLGRMLLEGRRHQIRPRVLAASRKQQAVVSKQLAAGSKQVAACRNQQATNSL